MKKLFTFIASLMLSANLFAAEEVHLLEWKTYANIGAWGGSWSGANDYDWMSYDYIWVKYSGLTGSINFGVTYSEWLATQQWGEQYDGATVGMTGTEGIVGIELEKFGTYVHGTKDGDFVGDPLAKHVREIFIQATSDASVTIEGIYLGSKNEYWEVIGLDQIQWTNLTKNSNCEGKDVSCLVGKDGADGGDFITKFEAGSGVDKSTAVVVTSIDNASQAWDTQFFVTTATKHEFAVGQKYRLKMSVRADAPAKISSQGHKAPGSYLNNDGVGTRYVTNEWQTIDYVGTCTGDGLQTIAFNLNEDKTLATKFYFDDIQFFIDNADATEADAAAAEMIDYEDIIVNGDLEGEGFENFRVNDYPPGMEKQSIAAPRVVAEDGNHFIIVTTNANFSQAWDAQFFITVPEEEAFIPDDVIRLKMLVRADATQNGDMQSHRGPGDYITGGPLPAINFTTEWTEYDSGFQNVTLQMSPADDFRTIAFNLSKLTEGNNVYFDEIQLFVKRAPRKVITWIDLVTNSDCEGTDGSCIIGKDGVDQVVGGENFVAGAGVDGTSALVVESVDNASNAWDTQFFITTASGHEFQVGEKYRVVFDYRSDAPATVSSQGHKEPGSYLSNDGVGNLNFTTQWQHLDKKGTCTKDGLKTIAFNLNENKTLATKFYIDNIQFMIDEDYATEEDLGVVTSVESVKAQQTPVQGIFNMAGQRVDKGYKGLIIKNGRKYIVK